MNTSKSLQGHFLVASPHLSDPNFFKSVVLIVQHDEDGAFGLILNRPTTKTVTDLWEMISEEPCHSHEHVHHGGPVEGPLTALHSRSDRSDRQVVPGVYFSASQEELAELIIGNTPHLRLFIGYAGWAGGQLESEISQGGWLSHIAEKETVFSDQEQMWKQTVELIGRNILAPTINEKHIPHDPTSN